MKKVIKRSGSKLNFMGLLISVGMIGVQIANNQACFLLFHQPVAPKGINDFLKTDKQY